MIRIDGINLDDPDAIEKLSEDHEIEVTHGQKIIKTDNVTFTQNGNNNIFILNAGTIDIDLS